jgi:hypothetical protein
MSKVSFAANLKKYLDADTSGTSVWIFDLKALCGA